MAYHHAMSLVPRRAFLALAAGALVPARALAAVPGGGSGAGDDRLVASALDYRITLERLALVQEEQLHRASGLLERYTDLFARGLVARRDVEDAASAVVAARERLARTRREIAAVETMVAEAEARRRVAALGPSRPGEVREGGGVIRGDGTRGWSLRDLPGIERFFVSRFGRPLPVSALGQTSVHDRLGFDHTQAADVALHPDSAEGRALIGYLLTTGIPFIAYRSAVGGASTGAHVHIGPPSQPVTVR